DTRRHMIPRRSPQPRGESEYPGSKCQPAFSVGQWHKLHMNAVEIEEAVSNFAAAPFDAAEFPFQFLTAFGNKETTVKKLRSGSSNSSDVPGGVLQRSNIHIAVCPEGKVGEMLAKLRASPKTAAGKAKFILATDGVMLEAEDLNSGETLACAYPDLPNRFSFFLGACGHHNYKADPRQRIRYQGHRASEQTLTSSF
ncbi:MAG: type IIL restriction-modification enzyme MmeI, partial [Candidatus Sulfotelmatobacter sp.]